MEDGSDRKQLGFVDYFFVIEELPNPLHIAPAHIHVKIAGGFKHRL
jgi:hypothetical protein